MQNAFIVSGGIAIGVTPAVKTFSQVAITKKFDFIMQSHPNLTLINTFFEAYANNNIDEIKKVLAGNIKWHIPGEHPLSGTKNGIEEVLSFLKKLNKGNFKAEPIVMGVNDHFVIDCHKNWSNIEGIENLNSMSCLLWKIENDKIIEVHNFPENQHIVDVFFNKLYQ